LQFLPGMPVGRTSWHVYLYGDAVVLPGREFELTAAGSSLRR
jgi:hypothetical protein